MKLVYKQPIQKSAIVKESPTNHLPFAQIGSILARKPGKTFLNISGYFYSLKYLFLIKNGV